MGHEKDDDLLGILENTVSSNSIRSFPVLVNMCECSQQCRISPTLPPQILTGAH